MTSNDRSIDRRLRVADAALLLLAREGARGLTHRAVDAELGLPNGSTSYYYRTRAALLQAAAERLLSLDTADLAAVTEDLPGMAKLVERWLAPDARLRSLARMELLLAAARTPELDFMARARKRFIDRAVRAQDGTDPEAARDGATALVALIDGLTLHGLVTGAIGKGAAQRMLERLRVAPSREKAATRSRTARTRATRDP